MLATGSLMYCCTTSSPAYLPVLVTVTVAVSVSLPFNLVLLSFTPL